MTDQTPEASAVESLDRWISAHGGALMEGDIDGLLDFLASDWLAEHTRRAQAQALRETAANIPAQVAIASHVRSRINLWLHADAYRIENGDSRG